MVLEFYNAKKEVQPRVQVEAVKLANNPGKESGRVVQIWGARQVRENSHYGWSSFQEAGHSTSKARFSSKTEPEYKQLALN